MERVFARGVKSQGILDQPSFEPIIVNSSLHGNSNNFPWQVFTLATWFPTNLAALLIDLDYKLQFSLAVGGAASCLGVAS